VRRNTSGNWISFCPGPANGPVCFLVSLVPRCLWSWGVFVQRSLPLVALSLSVCRRDRDLDRRTPTSAMSAPAAKKKAPTTETKPLPLWAGWLCGGLAGCNAEAWTLPIDITKVRLQVWRTHHPSPL
jgi:hypothetical protein